MLPNEITPLLITWNEEPNVRRTLDSLAWADDIVVVDSGSNDGTLEILRKQPRARVVNRLFDTFARQCAAGLEHIRTPWVLSLDADHVVSSELREELVALNPPADVAGYAIGFEYWVLGRPLRSSLYPPRIALFRRCSGRFVDDGHGHRIIVEGRVGSLENSLRHDDRKPVGRWLAMQARYASQEADKLVAAKRARLGFPDRVRRLVFVGPIAVLLYCLLFKRGILDGRAGWYYAFQRMIAEAILSLELLERASEAGRRPESRP